MPGAAEVSTVTAVYHAVEPEHLREALQALVDQTLPPSQCVVVADGPLPRALEDVLFEFDGRLPLTLVRRSRQGGSGPAKQSGLEASVAELVAIVDADDVSRADRLERQVALLQGRGADLVGAAMEEFDAETGKTWGVRRFPATHEAIVRSMTRLNPINHPTVMLRKDIALRAGGYTDLPFLEDYDLWARMLADGARAANDEQPLVRFRGGTATLKRRRSRGIARSEWTLQSNLASYGLFSSTRRYFNFFSRTAFRALPSPFMRIAYRRIFMGRSG